MQKRSNRPSRPRVSCTGNQSGSRWHSFWCHRTAPTPSGKRRVVNGLPARCGSSTGATAT